MNTKIILLDVNTDIVNAWEKYFVVDSVEIVNCEFKEYLDKHYNEIEAIVSPANSFGLMDGGYDAAIRAYFGMGVQEKVQEYILKTYHGEQVVGTAFTVAIPGTDKKLIHAPSMRVPSIIPDPNVIYHCMRSTLMEVIDNGISSVIIPAFGGLTGRVPPDVVALKMWGAFVQINMPPTVMNWDTIIDYTDLALWNGEKRPPKLEVYR